MSPDKERFREFLVKRRLELGARSPQTLRGQTALPDEAPSGQTVFNVEETGTCSWETFTWLPEIYKVGFTELFGALYPEWEQAFDAARDRLAAQPSLRPLLAAWERLPDDVRDFVLKGAGSAGSGGGSNGNGDGAPGGGVRARDAGVGVQGATDLHVVRGGENAGAGPSG